MKKIISFILCVVCLVTLVYGVEMVGDTVIGCGDHTLEEINIPHGAHSIESYAFKDCKHIKRVILPGTISSVGEGAFSGTDFSENVANYREGMLVANGVLIKVAPNVEIVRIPESVRFIAHGAFRDTGLKELYLPESIEKFSLGAFLDLTHKVAVYYGGSYLDFANRADFDTDKINLHTRDEVSGLVWLAVFVLAVILTIGAVVYPWKEEV